MNCPVVDLPVVLYIIGVLLGAMFGYGLALTIRDAKAK
jgi:hypothetical protein